MIRPHVHQAIAATRTAISRLRASVVRPEPETVVTPIFRSVRGDIQSVGPRRPKGTTAIGLRAFREARGMSADDVAFAIGLRLGEIERIEDGRVQPPLNVLAHLRDVLGADLNEIIGVAVPLGRLRMNGPGFCGRATFGFIDKLGGEDAVRRIVKPVRGKLRAQAIQNWHERRRVPHYAIHQMLAYAADNGINLSHEDFIPQHLHRDGSTSWPSPTLLGGSVGMRQPLPPNVLAFDPQASVPVIDPETGEPTGATITQGELYALVFSVFVDAETPDPTNEEPI